MSRTEHGNAGLDDTGFFRGNLLKGFAQILLVIQIDGRNDGGQRGDNIGGVETAAKPGFPQNDVHLLTRKMLERHDRDHLKECRQAVGRKFFQERLQTFSQPHDFRLGHWPAIHLNAFTEAQQMRRGVQPGLQPGLPADALQHGAHRPFAVGAGHVNETQAFVRIAGVCGQLARIVEAQLGTQQAQLVQPIDGFRIRHGF